jgi:hypothetical protein
MKYHLTLKKDELSSHEKTWRNFTKWNKPIQRDCILYGSNSMIFWERENYEDSRKIKWLAGREKVSPNF